MMHQSIATIDSPEFINLQPLDLNPLMSKCDIKVLYVGENRNRSYISKEVATEISKTLRGAPIVGYYNPDKKDFRDHGEKVTLDADGIHFETLTKPYGFVAPDADVWFQKFEDYDDFGNATIREYLMTTGFLWTGQFEECQVAVSEGRPQSMELDVETIDGHWSTNPNNGIEFFIINDAIFSKLCILGEDVEPCFEGASIVADGASVNFTLDSEFKTTLYNMMQDLKNFALKGGNNMSEVTKDVETFAENPVEETPAADFVEEATEEVDTYKKKDEEEKDSESEDNTEEETENKEANDSSSVPEKEKEEDDEEEKKKLAKSSLETVTANQLNATDINASGILPADAIQTNSITAGSLKDGSDTVTEQYETLKVAFEKLSNEYQDLQTRFEELVAFKASIEDAKKDELIQSFYMLSEEDKKDVIENKSKYTYDEIEAKLSVICFRKKVNFDLEDSTKKEKSIEDNDSMTTFNLDTTESNIPGWIKALQNRKKN